ncbi:MAG: twin-arginine translocase TatA/TatE family subunit [Magnetococcales bacterium]|nr:twin-arginine translocase TatA/TatE family subunit [Magnetococcales bacterium]
MLGFDWSEMLVIMVVALIAIGPDKLPEVARSIAKTVRQIRRLTSEIRESINLDEIGRHGHDFIGGEGMRPFALPTTQTPPPAIGVDMTPQITAAPQDLSIPVAPDRLPANPSQSRSSETEKDLPHPIPVHSPAGKETPGNSQEMVPPKQAVAPEQTAPPK